MISHQRYSAKADVFSFAVLLCQLLGGGVPYADKFLTPIQVHSPRKRNHCLTL